MSEFLLGCREVRGRLLLLVAPPVSPRMLADGLLWEASRCGSDLEADVHARVRGPDIGLPSDTDYVVVLLRQMETPHSETHWRVGVGDRIYTRPLRLGTRRCGRLPPSPRGWSVLRARAECDVAPITRRRV